MTFPITEINLLLAMARGTTPFNLVQAIKAALAIATYLAGTFSPNAVALPLSATPEFGLEQGLVAVAEQHNGTVDYAAKHNIAVSKAGMSLSLLNFVMVEVMKWISEQVAK